MTFKDILEFNFVNIGDFHLSLYHLLAAFLVITIARIFVALFTKILNRYFNRKHVDAGRQYAFTQFMKYIIYTSAILMAFEAVGISLSVLWGGAAALMVGIGLGLQQTFNDLVSGLILLIEGSVEVGDIIEVSGVVGRVTDIGMRTSKVETRDKIAILIPNSKLVGDNATNWSHSPEPSRFHVKVGVAYSSNVELVTQLLKDSVKNNPLILSNPEPEIQFIDFGNSSLDFRVMFYCENYMGIEGVKSDVRYRITQLFRENKVEIPFPQTDLWVRNPQDLRPAAIEE